MNHRRGPQSGRITIALLLLAGTASGAAAKVEQAETRQELQPIVVEGQSETQREDLKADSPTNLYRVEASGRFDTEVFTEKDIKALHPENVFDLLDKAAGVNLIYQGRRSPFIVEERGGGTFTYIIDGAVLPPSSNRILYKFPVAAIEEVQIVRGSTALTLGPSIPIGASNSGSGLNTGFIIIRTKQPKKTEATLTASAEKAIGGHPVETNESLYVKGAGGVRMNPQIRGLSHRSVVRDGILHPADNFRNGSQATRGDAPMIELASFKTDGRPSRPEFRRIDENRISYGGQIFPCTRRVTTGARRSADPQTGPLANKYAMLRLLEAEV